MASPLPTSQPGVVRHLRLADRDDTALVEALRSERESACTELFDRYSPYLTRIILRIIGDPSEVPELVNEAVFRAIQRINSLDEPANLRPWIAAIGVFVAREYVRARSRRRWTWWLGREQVPEQAVPAADNDQAEAVREVYRLLDKMPVDERIVFAMRYLDDMGVADIAVLCQVSLATAKRHLARAEARFGSMSRANPVLKTWLEEGV